MSRAVKPDYAYNKERFTNLLIKAQGRLTVTDYAKECGVSLAYMCKYLNGKFDKAPTPSTIRKISKYTEKNGVTEEALLEAAGYSASKYADENNARTLAIKFKTYSVGTITKALSLCDFKWNVKQATDLSLFDLGVDITDSDADIDTWLFKFVANVDDLEPVSDFQQRVYAYYAKLVCSQLTPKTKISYVTNSEVIYNDIKATQPKLLPMYASVILINNDDLKVIKEEYLDTYLDLSTSVKTKYLIK